MIFVYPFGIPLLYISLCYIKRHRINPDPLAVLADIIRQDAVGTQQRDSPVRSLRRASGISPLTLLGRRPLLHPATLPPTLGSPGFKSAPAPKLRDKAALTRAALLRSLRWR